MKRVSLKLIFKLFGAAIMGLGLAVPLAYSGEELQNTSIKTLTSYPNYCGGDVLITLEPSLTECSYAYIDADDPSSDQTYSLLLAAHMAGKKIDIYVYTDQNNSCISSSPVCKVRGVSLTK